MAPQAIPVSGHSGGVELPRASGGGEVSISVEIATDGRVVRWGVTPEYMHGLVAQLKRDRAALDSRIAELEKLLEQHSAPA